MASKGVQVGSNGSKSEMPLLLTVKNLTHEAAGGGPKKPPGFIHYESLVIDVI